MKADDLFCPRCKVQHPRVCVDEDGWQGICDHCRMVIPIGYWLTVQGVTDSYVFRH